MPSSSWPFTRQLNTGCILQRGFGVNIGSGNGLVPSGTKPLPKPMLTYHIPGFGMTLRFGGQFWSHADNHKLYTLVAYLNCIELHGLPVMEMAYATDTLTHWGRVTHICVGKLTNIGSDNGLSPGRRQAIIWTNAGILLIRPLGTNFSEFLIIIHTFSFNEMQLKMSSAKWRPFCLGLNVLKSLWSLDNSYSHNNILHIPDRKPKSQMNHRVDFHYLGPMGKQCFKSTNGVIFWPARMYDNILWQYTVKPLI